MVNHSLVTNLVDTLSELVNQRGLYNEIKTVISQSFPIRTFPAFEFFRHHSKLSVERALEKTEKQQGD